MRAPGQGRRLAVRPGVHLSEVRGRLRQLVAALAAAELLSSVLHDLFKLDCGRFVVRKRD